MAPSMGNSDRLFEWQPGPSDAAAPNVIAATIWGARRAWHSKTLIAYLWALYVVIVKGAGTALQGTLGSATSQSIPVGELNVSLFSAQSLDISYLGMVLNSITRPLWIPNGHFFLFFGMIAGGAIAYLHSPRQAPVLAQIGGNCGAYIGRFIRLALIAAALSWFIPTLGPVSIRRFVPAFSVGLYELIVQYLIVVCAVVIDYARVRTVLRDSRSMLMETVRSLKFVVRNLAWILQLEVLFFSFAALLGAAILVASNVLHNQASLHYIGFATEQVYVIALIWLRLAAWGSMMALYQGVTLKRLAKVGV